MKGYDFLKIALQGETRPKTIIKTEHERQYADDWKEYDYYIFHADNMFHRCNEEGKLGSKYQDRFLNYKVLQKDFVVHYIPAEEEIEDNKKIEKLDKELIYVREPNGFEHPDSELPSKEKMFNKINEIIDKLNEVLNEKD